MKRLGFTLIELLVVIVIIGILAGIGITTFKQSNNKAHDAVFKEALSRIVQKIQLKAIDGSGLSASIIDVPGVDYSKIKILDLLADSMDVVLKNRAICHGASKGRFFVAGKLLGVDDFFVKGSAGGVSDFNSLTLSQKSECKLGSLSNYLLEEFIIFQADGEIAAPRNSTSTVSLSGDNLVFSVQGQYAHLAWIRLTKTDGSSIGNIQWRASRGNPWTITNTAYHLAKNPIASGESYNVEVQLFDYIPDENGGTTLANGDKIRVESFYDFSGSFVSP